MHLSELHKKTKIFSLLLRHLFRDNFLVQFLKNILQIFNKKSKRLGFTTIMTLACECYFYQLKLENITIQLRNIIINKINEFDINI
jgi:hypothetical protein